MMIAAASAIAAATATVIAVAVTHFLWPHSTIGHW
jgi:hypothetical protein